MKTSFNPSFIKFKLGFSSLTIGASSLLQPEKSRGRPVPPKTFWQNHQEHDRKHDCDARRQYLTLRVHTLYRFTFVLLYMLWYL